MIDKKFIINRLGKVSKKGALMTEFSRQWYFGILVIIMYILMNLLNRML